MNQNNQTESVIPDLTRNSRGFIASYCSGPMRSKVTVVAAKAGIRPKGVQSQYRRATTDLTLAFARVTNSYIFGPHQC